MAPPKPPYGRAFWAEAVRLVNTPGHSIRSVAEDLGVSYEGLRRHVHQAAVDTGETTGLTTDERAELTRLRRENRTLRMEREILKKAAVFFATETDETR
jgi:transposase